MSGPTYHPDVKQGTPEWDAVRAGHWSSSNAATIMGGPDTKGLGGLVKRIAWERVNGPLLEPSYKSAAMDRGNKVEPAARDWFAFRELAVMEEVGFVQHARLAWVGWSPDGLHARRRRGIEAKCPLHAAYMEALAKREVPAEYRWQCAWACWVGQLDGLDFIAYHPQMGGLVVPYEPSPSNADRMQARVEQLEKLVAPWVALLTEQKTKGNA